MTIAIRDESPPTDQTQLSGYLDRLRTAVWDNWRSLLGSGIFNGDLLTGQAIAVGDNEMAHRLGRKPQGYIILREQGASLGLFTTEANWAARTDLLVTLTAGSAGFADFYFY